MRICTLLHHGTHVTCNMYTVMYGMYMLLVLYTLGHIVHDQDNVYMYENTWYISTGRNKTLF